MITFLQDYRLHVFNVVESAALSTTSNDHALLYALHKKGFVVKLMRQKTFRKKRRFLQYQFSSLSIQCTLINWPCYQVKLKIQEKYEISGIFVDFVYM